MSSPLTKPTRAEINRANSEHSTGPKTVEGKLRSSRNSFKHGLYSKQVVIPGEDPALFDQLRADLRAEHQPASPTEEILVDELAQHFWRMNRFRRLETQMWTAVEGKPELGLDIEQLIRCENCGLLTIVHRALASAERSFHRTLTALSKLRKDAGFVSRKTSDPIPEPASDGSAEKLAEAVATPAPVCAISHAPAALPAMNKSAIDRVVKGSPEEITRAA